MALIDRYGLAISTSSAAAAEHFEDGMDRLLSYGPGAEESFAAALEACRVQALGVLNQRLAGLARQMEGLMNAFPGATD